MTTINNSENLIERVGGIEKAREIIAGAPSNAVIYWPIAKGNFGVYSAGEQNKSDRQIVLNDLRTAIAEHDTTQLCIGCGSPDLHKGGEIKEPKMCLDCFAEMVGFTRTSNGFIESDHVTDIRNHLSPSTLVVDL